MAARRKKKRKGRRAAKQNPPAKSAKPPSAVPGRDREPAKHEPNNERKVKPQPKLARAHHERSRMEVAIYVTGVLSAILVIVSGVLLADGHHRDLGLWTAFVAIVFAGFGACCWYQDHLWKSDAAATAIQQPANAENRAWLFMDHPKMMIPEKEGVLHVGFHLKNTGTSAATLIGMGSTLFYFEHGVRQPGIGRYEPGKLELEIDKVGCDLERTAAISIANKQDTAVPPGSTVPFGVADERMRPAAQLQEIRTRARAVVLLTLLIYTDSTGVEHRTRQCFLLDPIYGPLPVPDYAFMK